MVYSTILIQKLTANCYPLFLFWRCASIDMIPKNQENMMSPFYYPMIKHLVGLTTVNIKNIMAHNLH
jgi:hypothetical protein